MSDTPDFDKMTPDEIMKWMESLAKRQGATEGFTTEANMEVAEISADDERAQGLGEYVPFGWKAEDWKKHLEKEEAEKQRKAAAAPPAAAVAKPVTPPPAPVAVAAQPAAQAAASDTPDFDKMSPEEIMKWMESLAKRQGAVEGFTTAADMDVKEVAADDERAQGLSEYVPFEWRNKPDEWRKKEAEEKQRKAAQPPAPAAAAAKPVTTLQPPAQTSFTPPPPVQQPAASIQPADTLDSFFNSGGLPILETDDDDETVAATSANPMDWLTGLTGESEDSMESLAGGELDDPFAALEALASGKDDVPDSMDWLAGLADTDNSLDALSSLADIAPGDPLSALGDMASASSQQVSASPIGPGEGVDPLAWMESLAAQQGADPSELSTDANVPIVRPAAILGDGPGYTPYSVEGDNELGLDDIALPSEDLSWLTDSDEDDDEGMGELESESPADWLDQIASGVSSEDEAPVAAMGLPLDADDKYQDEVENVDPDEIMKKLNQAKNVSPQEIEGMFDALFKKAEEFAALDEEEFPLPEDEPSGAIEAQIPDWLAETMVESAPKPPPVPAAAIEDVLAGLDEPLEAGEAIPAAEAGDMPDWLTGMSETVEAGAQSVEPVVDLDMPDWLTASDDVVVEDVPAAVPADLPDWLQAEAPETGNIQEDIFAAPPAAETSSTTMKSGVVLDTSDPWVKALTEETEHADQLARWYAEQTGTVAAGVVAEAVAAAAPAPVPVKAQPVTPPPATVQPAAGLQAVELPVEADLPAGEPEAVPDWLTGEVTAVFGDTIEAEEGMPDWLNTEAEEAADMPDWLKAGVDDTVTASGGDMPNWLEGMDVGEEEIPAWLYDTMQGDEQAAVSVDAFSFESETAPVDEVVAAPVQAAPPAPRPKASPAPVVASNINVAAVLQSARGKVSGADIDGALLEYESIVRANAGLDDVVNDLTRLVEDKSFKKNPAIFRVLGDGLMRRGNLQQALDTYRKALNLL